MQLIHVARAMRAVTTREIVKFVQQRGRLLSAIVRPLMWLAVFAAGFHNLLRVDHPALPDLHAYQVYVVPGLIGMILLSRACGQRCRWSTTARRALMRSCSPPPAGLRAALLQADRRRRRCRSLQLYVFLLVCLPARRDV